MSGHCIFRYVGESEARYCVTCERIEQAILPHSCSDFSVGDTAERRRCPSRMQDIEIPWTQEDEDRVQRVCEEARLAYAEAIAAPLVASAPIEDQFAVEEPWTDAERARLYAAETGQ